MSKEVKKDNPLIIELSKPIKFEDKTVEKIDLTGLEKLKTSDLIELEKQFNLDGNFSSQPEASVAYARLVSNRVTDLPLEFFDQLGAKNIIKVKTAVMNFFYGEE
ncbi:MAG: Uncharacterized protein AWL62_1292 [Halanaerobium sp. T82-1]|jgi:hypothetical protein|nr:MAG: Uncharacterized protein AWL62_1292 [Halanaerobium sp. T82-1]